MVTLNLKIMKCNSTPIGFRFRECWCFSVLVLLSVLFPLHSMASASDALKHKGNRNVWIQEMITGTVTDGAGDPIAGVTVTVVRTGASSATTETGGYAIAVQAGDLLRFTAIGYATVEVAV